MDLNEEPNSLIDWNAPAVEYSSKPLIPLPSSNDQIQINEDSPFDAVERQINENEMFDLFNLNLSFHTDEDRRHSCECGKLIDHAVDEMLSIKSNTSSRDEIIKISTDIICNEDEDSVSECKIPAKSASEPDKLPLDMSCLTNLSSIAEIKEIIRNRLSRYADEPLHQSSTADSSSNQLSLSLSSISKYSNFLNNGFILSKTENISKSVDSELTKTADDVEDIQSIMPNWDEFVLSSSDEELENAVRSKSNSEKSQCINKMKKLPSASVGKTRVPLVFQDPNIRIKKANSLSKEGPLKAVISLSNMSKKEDRKANAAMVPKQVTSKTSKMNPPLLGIKQKRKSVPIATSTPRSQGYLTDAKNSLNQIRNSPKTYSRPPSPDSTSNFRLSRINSGMITNPKRISARSASDLVSSSTNVSFPGASRLTKSYKKENIQTVASSGKSVGKPRPTRNKENVSPFRK